jgi:hypothetical protein
MLKAVMVNFAPEDGGVESYILLHLRNFSGLAQVAEVELAALDKQKRPARSFNNQGACRLRHSCE